MIKKSNETMKQQLYLVLGGELKDLNKIEFKNCDQIDIVGIFSDHKSAYDAWKEKALSTVDSAHIRYFIVDLEGFLKNELHVLKI